MAPFLMDNFFLLQGNPEEAQLSDTEDDEIPVSVWIKDKDIIRASTDISLIYKIEPGVYTVDFTRDQGLFCKKIEIKSDELFVFTDSITQKLLDEINLFWSKHLKLRCSKEFLTHYTYRLNFNGKSIVKFRYRNYRTGRQRLARPLLIYLVKARPITDTGNVYAHLY